MDKPGDLAGKVAIVTGSARNMGRGFARALAARGADIVVHHHDERARGDARSTAELVQEAGARAVVVGGDLAQVGEVRRLFAEAQAAFGGVDIVINNAGLVVKKPFTEITEAEFDRSFGINAKAAFFVMQEAARRIRDHGRIINLGTTILGATIPFYAVYAGSKAPLEAFTRALAKEIGHRGVTVNTIAPGPVDTAFYHGPEDAASIARATQATAAQRLGAVDDIVPVVDFLASERSRWVTGQTLFVNGGYLAR